MLFALELVLHPNQHMIAHVFGPAHQFRCSPLLVMLVRCGHMPSGSAHAVTIAPWMTSDTRSVEVQTHELSTGVDIDTFAGIRSGIAKNVHGGETRAIRAARPAKMAELRELEKIIERW